MKIPTLPPVIWAACALAVLAAVWLLWWAILIRPAQNAADTQVATAQASMADARTASARDAQITTDTATKAAATDEQTSRENADAIRNACPGPDCNRAALVRVCRRPTYSQRPDCVQLLGRPQPAG